jgi:hypothetical protein
LGSPAVNVWTVCWPNFGGGGRRWNLSPTYKLNACHGDKK